MKQYFKADSSMDYVIYGAGGNCYHVIKTLKESACRINTILDQRAKEIQYINNIPVCTLEDYICPNPKKTVFIVTIKNVFEHIDIARKLISKGYCNLIYKPLPILKNAGDEEWNSINTAYELLLSKEDPVISGEAIAASRNGHLEIFRDELMIDKTEQEITCWLPVELIFNYDNNDIYGRISMAAYYPLINLYQYLLGQLSEESWEDIRKDYLLYSAEWVHKKGQMFTKELEESLLHSRIGSFEGMQQKAGFDKDFFIRNAVTVKHKKHLQFHLVSSGRNRVAFLIAKGYRYVPVKMDMEDYFQWINHPAAHKIENYLQLQGASELFVPIPHPLFATVKVQIPEYSRLFSQRILLELYRILHWKATETKNNYKKINGDILRRIKKNLKIFIAVNDNRNLIRSITLEGMTCYWEETQKAENGISGLLDQLFDMHDLLCQKESGLEFLSVCQVLVIDSRLYKEDYDSRFNGNLIFLLSWKGSESILKKFIQKGFYIQKYLFRSLWKETEVQGIMLKQ